MMEPRIVSGPVLGEASRFYRLATSLARFPPCHGQAPWRQYPHDDRDAARGTLIAMPPPMMPCPRDGSLLYRPRILGVVADALFHACLVGRKSRRARRPLASSRPWRKYRLRAPRPRRVETRCLLQQIHSECAAGDAEALLRLALWLERGELLPLPWKSRGSASGGALGLPSMAGDPPSPKGESGKRKISGAATASAAPARTTLSGLCCAPEIIHSALAAKPASAQSDGAAIAGEQTESFSRKANLRVIRQTGNRLRSRPPAPPARDR